MNIKCDYCAINISEQSAAVTVSTMERRFNSKNGEN